jgi:hypothetical protein
MPRRRARHWHVVGGYAFAHDPNIIAGPEPISWLPEVFPAVLLLTPAPPGFGTVKPIDPTILTPIAAAHRDDIGYRHIIKDPDGFLEIASDSDQALRHPAVILPLDASIDLRIDALRRLVRRLRGKPAGSIPRGLQLTPLQKTRLIQLLHAQDIRSAGGGPREVAAEVLRSKQAGLRSIEWKDSAARRRAIRLLRDAKAHVHGGYLKLLRGE